MSLGLIELVTGQPGDAPETATDADGWVYLVDTGEVVGRAGPGGEAVPERFEVRDGETADWALRVRAEAEAEIVKLDAQFRGLRRQYDARRAAQLRRLSYWEFRFGPALVAYARSQLGGKARTWRGAFGSVSFRRTPGSTAIVDGAAAVEFVKTWEPARVKVVESVTVKAVLAARDRAAAATGEAIDLPFVAAAGPGESVTIETGVEVQGVES